MHERLCICFYQSYRVEKYVWICALPDETMLYHPEGMQKLWVELSINTGLDFIDLDIHYKFGYDVKILSSPLLSFLSNIYCAMMH